MRVPSRSLGLPNEWSTRTSSSAEGTKTRLPPLVAGSRVDIDSSRHSPSMRRLKSPKIPREPAVSSRRRKSGTGSGHLHRPCGTRRPPGAQALGIATRHHQVHVLHVRHGAAMDHHGCASNDPPRIRGAGRRLPDHRECFRKAIRKFCHDVRLSGAANVRNARSTANVCNGSTADIPRLVFVGRIGHFEMNRLRNDAAVAHNV